MRGVVVNYQERRIWNVHEQIDRTIGINLVPEELRVPQLLGAYIEDGEGSLSGLSHDALSPG
jgi:hypothetical protein